jgi:hypothetical protein
MGNEKAVVANNVVSTNTNTNNEGNEHRAPTLTFLKDGTDETCTIRKAYPNILIPLVQY